MPRPYEDWDDLREDIREIRSDISRLIDELSPDDYSDRFRLRALQRELSQRELPEANQLNDFIYRTNRLIERLERILAYLDENAGDETWPEDTNSIGIDLMSYSQTVEREMEFLQALLDTLRERAEMYDSTPSLVQHIASAKQWLNGSFIPTLRRALSRIWQLIAKLLTPKEWKLKGSIGNQVWGLSKVEVEITFGP